MLRIRITRSGCSGLTNANQSVISAFWSKAVMGASRWLAPNAWGVDKTAASAHNSPGRKSRL
jgi:hypothetical protein